VSPPPTLFLKRKALTEKKRPDQQATSPQCSPQPSSRSVSPTNPFLKKKSVDGKETP